MSRGLQYIGPIHVNRAEICEPLHVCNFPVCLPPQEKAPTSLLPKSISCRVLLHVLGYGGLFLGAKPTGKFATTCNQHRAIGIPVSHSTSAPFS